MSLWSLDGYSPAARRSIRLDLLACAVSVLLVLVVSANSASPARLLLATAFTFFVPGRAIVTNWPRMGRWSAVGSSVVFSLGVLTLLATLMLWAHYWHPLGLFIAEAVASLAGLIRGIVRRQRSEITDDEW